MMSVSQNDSSSRVNVFFRSFVTRALRCVEPTSTEFQPQLLTDLSRLSNGCSLYVWCLVCPRSHSALPLCLHFHRPFAHIRSSFCRTFFMDSSSLLCLPSPLLCFSLFFRSASYPSSSSPSLLLLPLSSPSSLISLRPFLLLLLCPLPSIPYFSFFMSSFPRYHSGAGGSSPLSPRFSSLVSSIDI